MRAVFHLYGAVRHMLEIAKYFVPQSRSTITTDASNLWGSSTSDSHVRDLSHWIGEGRWVNEQAWNRIGQMHFEMFKKICLLANVTQPICSMVEWGSGGGANAVRFCSEVTTFYGVDISSANLAECQRQLKMRNFCNFRPVLIDIEEPEQCLRVIESPVDFFISTAVYQHFPSKEYGIHITELAHRLLADGGLALIQIRYNDGFPRLRAKRRNYYKNVVTFAAYGIHEFWQAVQCVGFDPLAVILDPSVCYAYFFLKKERPNA